MAKLECASTTPAGDTNSQRLAWSALAGDDRETRVPRFQDAFTLMGRPKLWFSVQRARSLGLESLLDYQRLSVLAAAARLSRRATGDAIECGAYRGGSAAVIGLALRGSGKTLHVCDSFEGLPAPTAPDNYHQAGDFSDTGADVVARHLSDLGVTSRTHVGWFKDTLPQLSDRRFALAHVDADLYESVLEALRFCYPRMSPGGIVIVDDYASPTCLGTRMAVDEFFSGRPERPVVLSGPQCGVWIGMAGHDLRRTLLAAAVWYGGVERIAALALRVPPR